MTVDSRVVEGMALGLGLRVSLKSMFSIQGQLVGCRNGAGSALAQGLNVRVSSTVSARVWVSVTVRAWGTVVRRVFMIAHV